MEERGGATKSKAEVSNFGRRPVQRRTRRRVFQAAAAIFALGLLTPLLARGAESHAYTAAVSPVAVKPSSTAAYTVAVTNAANSPDSARQATIAVSDFVNISTSTATTSASGQCSAAVWNVEWNAAESRIFAESPGGTATDLCPGGVLTVAFQAMAPAAEGSYEWGTALFGRGSVTFATAGPHPTVTVDGTAPARPRIDSGPPRPTNQKSSTFTFSSTEAGVTFDCAIDDGAFQTCASPTTTPELSDGPHRFAVRAVDGVGNASETASYEWTVDTVPPDTEITSRPPVVTGSRVATFGFSGTGEPARFSCSLDASTFTTCDSPQRYEDLADGAHTFQVEATDAAGNADPSPATWTWSVDGTAPDPPLIVSGPATPTNQRSARFAFTGREPGLVFSCRLDDNAEEPCSSPLTYQGLPDGTHAFRVSARDEADSVSAAAVYGWTVDTVAPGTVITSAPPATSGSASATFNFSSTEERSSFICSLNGEAYAACAPPRTYGGLANGLNAFQVRATDAAGNTDDTPAAHTWTVNVPAPVDRTPTRHVTGVTKAVGYRLLRLRWTRPPDQDFDHVVLRVGNNPRRAPRTLVYRGASTTYANRRFRNGSYYRYSITSYDRAGNPSRRVFVVVRPSALLASPRVGARVQRPPLLDWASVPKATFYNVQLYLGSKKLLSAWPGRSSFKLKGTWSYNDARFRLKTGKYRWYVWPGFGPRSKPNYGEPVGHSSFIVAR
jgi:hypothetical protein